MSLEPIGVFTIVAGVCCLLLGYPAAAMVFVVMTVFGAAAAIVAGAANIQPAHLFLLFFAVATLSWRKNAMTAMQALRPGQPAFWLACLVVYGAASGFFSPRLLAGLPRSFPWVPRNIPQPAERCRWVRCRATSRRRSILSPI
ncbi:hypothetical protein [Rhizobium sp. BG6]|uniref:hypothetical protein n=1 Tax=Rhizobium sp. BG6 TaxID=2613771 RepID=UPI001FEE9748|nr:hypothetical protein [Rhizobium sp. BG6]